MRTRKPWEEPVRYVEDRFDVPDHLTFGKQAANQPPSRGASDNGEERDADEVEELLNRPESEEERIYECNDTTPVDYSKGPHDEELGVDGNEFDNPDNDPVPYDRGPKDEEDFGIDEDEDEFEPLDDEPEFPDDI